MGEEGGDLLQIPLQMQQNRRAKGPCRNRSKPWPACKKPADAGGAVSGGVAACGVAAGEIVLAANSLQMQPASNPGRLRRKLRGGFRDLGKPGVRDHIGRARFRRPKMSDSPAPQDPRHDLWDNPMGTDGFEFVEYTGPDPQQLAALFQQMGFAAAARHRSKNVTLYKQGDVNFILNAEPESFAQAFARLHGPSVCAIAFRVKDAAAAYQRAISLGAKPVHGKLGPDGAQHPGHRGIGGSLIYLVDRYGDHTILRRRFHPLAPSQPSRKRGGKRGLSGAGLAAIDHLTHNVHRGRMSPWAEFSSGSSIFARSAISTSRAS
jgi:hypothetical protein